MISLIESINIPTITAPNINTPEKRTTFDTENQPIKKFDPQLTDKSEQSACEQVNFTFVTVGVDSLSGPRRKQPEHNLTAENLEKTELPFYSGVINCCRLNFIVELDPNRL